MDKNKIMLIIIIVLLVLLLGAIGFVGVKAMTMFNPDKSIIEEEFIGKTEILLPEEMTTITLDTPISTNLKKGADEQDHNIRVSVAFGIDSRDIKAKEYKAFLETFNSNLNVLVRSTCLSIIRSKTYEEMTMPDAEDVLAQEILTELQDVFKSNYLNSVYVFDMYVQ